VAGSVSTEDTRRDGTGWNASAARARLSAVFEEFAVSVSRRKILAAGGVVAVSAMADPLGISRAAATGAPVIGPARTTLDGTLALPDRADGVFRKPMFGPPEPHIVRADLGAGASSATQRPLLAFAQMTDLQIVDDQSPARFEFLDRMARYAPPYEGAYPTKAAYRPQEMLSTQLSDAVCRGLQNVGRGPRTDLPIGFTIVTGDMVDNCQYNETRWYIDLLDGELVHPDSGSLTQDHSVGGGAFGALVEDYWHPQSKQFQLSRGKLDRYYRAGFPEVLSLPGAARRPFQATGLGMPWYAAVGNHDLLVQGNVLPGTQIELIFDRTPDLRELAVGDFKPSDLGNRLPDDLNDDPDLWDVLTDYWAFFWAALNPMPGLIVPADPARRLLSKSQFIAEHFNTTGLPAGHGFTAGSGKGYYEFDAGPDGMFKFICLDTVRDDLGGSRGAIDSVQFNWLRDRLIANSSAWAERRSDGSYAHRGHDVDDKLIVIFCHHTLNTMTNDTDLPDPGARTWYPGSDLRRLLELFPNVVLMVNGHTHKHNIWAHERPAAIGYPGGFWEVNTASHIDWPIQSRIIEISEAAGVLSIFTTMVDADAPARWDGTTATPEALAALGRELAANDPQIASNGDGEADARNTELLLPAPFPMLKLAGNSYGVDVAVLRGAPWHSDSNTVVVRGQGPYTWTFTGLPPGLTWNASGVITGTFTQAGIFPVSFTVTDTFGHAFSNGFTFTVNIATPDLRDRTLAAATSTLQAAGLRLGTVGSTPVEEALDAGKVRSQSPVAGAPVQPDTPVKVYLGLWNGNRK
jgi:metallophosphoesterase (TIGR03767 family)